MAPALAPPRPGAVCLREGDLRVTQGSGRVGAEGQEAGMQGLGRTGYWKGLGLAGGGRGQGQERSTWGPAGELRWSRSRGGRRQSEDGGGGVRRGGQEKAGEKGGGSSCAGPRAGSQVESGCSVGSTPTSRPRGASRPQPAGRGLMPTPHFLSSAFWDPLHPVGREKVGVTERREGPPPVPGLLQPPPGHCGDLGAPPQGSQPLLHP